jgi:hypothetical protein
VTAWRGAKLRARTGSAGGLAAVDVQDMAGDERRFVDEDDRVGQLMVASAANWYVTENVATLKLSRCGWSTVTGMETLASAAAEAPRTSSENPRSRRRSSRPRHPLGLNGTSASDAFLKIEYRRRVR